MIYGDNEDEIIGQYVLFTKVYDEQRKQYGRTRKAIEETIRICKEQNVLKEYLQSREVGIIMNEVNDCYPKEGPIEDGRIIIIK